ncbi:uncharacterized protein LOC143915296 [Arctopsyche grandis]|uniref:uncharacterized protein LOC143915296 n=1 Tax=Arctopsyche grandis TaxID=121162 RepID=UPI00406D795A
METKTSFLIVGGIDDDNSGLVEEFHPISKRWNNFYNFGKRMKEFSSVIVDKKMYMFGGRLDNRVSDKVWCLDLVLKSSKELSPMQYRRTNAAVAEVDGIIYVIGGVDSGDNSLNSVEAFNIESEVCRTVSSMHIRRFNHAAVVIKNTIYVIGGYDNDNTLQDVEVYYTSTDTWKFVCPMNIERMQFAAVNLKDNIYVMGGDDGNETVSSVEQFDPVKNHWTKVPNLPEALKGHSAVVHDNKIICFGNKNSFTVREYNPNMKEWTSIGPMKSSRHSYTALVKMC